MAKAATAEAIAEEEGPDVRGLPDEITRINDMKKATAEKAGTQGDETKKIVDQKGYNKTAFDQLCKIGRMSEDKRNDFLATMIPGLETMMPIWGADATSDLFGHDKEMEEKVHKLRPDDSTDD